jgi:eukaryotic-like serine/threonine-protein kinase
VSGQVCKTCGGTFPLNLQKCPTDGSTLISQRPRVSEATLTNYTLSRGYRMGDYICEEPLGVGGMGEVWRCLHEKLQKQVAIKVLRLGLTEDASNLQRFFQEARAVSAIRHRGLVDVFAFEEMLDGRPYIVMEYLQGKSLATYLEDRRPLPYNEALEITRQLCQTLQAVHQKGVTHRDIKPDNIFLVLEDGLAPAVKILDFGIAKLKPLQGEKAAQLTTTGAIFGTPAYMSPEQCDGSALVDHRADLYALAVIVFEALVGVHPFRKEGDSAGRMIARQLYEAPPVPTALAPKLKVWPYLNKFFERALAKDPDARYQSSAEFAEAFLSVFMGRAKDSNGRLLTPAISWPAVSPSGTPSAWPVLQSVHSQPSDDLSFQTTIEHATLPPTSKPTTIPPGVPQRISVVLFLGAAVMVAGVWSFSTSTSPPTTSVLKGAASAPASLSVLESHTKKITLRSTPVGARVYSNGRLLGKTPFSCEVPLSQDIPLRFEAAGFQSTDILLQANESNAEPKLLPLLPGSLLDSKQKPVKAPPKK